MSWCSCFPVGILKKPRSFQSIARGLIFHQVPIKYWGPKKFISNSKLHWHFKTSWPFQKPTSFPEAPPACSVPPFLVFRTSPTPRCSAPRWRRWASTVQKHCSAAKSYVARYNDATRIWRATHLVLVVKLWNLMISWFSWWEKIADVNRDFFERFLVLQLVVRLKGYSNRVIIGGLSLILVFWIFSFRSPLIGVLVNAGRSTTFLVARAGGEPAFFPQIQRSMPTANESIPRGSPKNRGFGQWIRVGWPSLGRRLGGGPVPLVSSQKRDWFLHGNWCQIKDLLLHFFAKKSSVFFVVAAVWPQVTHMK